MPMLSIGIDVNQRKKYCGGGMKLREIVYAPFEVQK